MGQLYYRNLFEHFFDRYPNNATKFIAVSGYLGPDPIKKLHELPFPSQIVYGLQRETPNSVLHAQLVKETTGKVSVYYPEIPSHAKCYLWMEGDRPIRGLVGSANFSTNGLRNDFRETLIEVERPDLHSVLGYLNLLLERSMICTEVQLDQRPTQSISQTEHCDMVLYDPRTGEVQESSGLNWGFADAHVAPNDAYIPIRVKHIKQCPNLFQPIFFNPEAGHRSRNEYEKVELIWDDGVVMPALFEGSQPIDGRSYPKQISSVPNKSILGEYIRDRIGKQRVTDTKDSTQLITRQNLEKYGRNFVRLSLLQPGVYYADFSPDTISF
ncbi:restriction endonuclease PLD domain-containing protein [Orrella daihaiensis]|uniref:NgoFVII family restriction endonuclease n=1 Tax=Orrella daihaiensis TaxID=2782176 RepID=A0ABY4AK97_9BURK|nr:restriction endonuclease PLD domain-containing protein [Orrella daihaiensis]UOD50698.1 NgoFVII family restriction endonuclease [Orrella daihaiensis]